MSSLAPRPLILGHRGAPWEATENTLRSFALALERGADGVELDIQRTRDGVPVVIHDPTLDRTTMASGAVGDLTWPEIAHRAGGLVPRFEEVAAWAAGARAWLNVEMKAGGVEREVVRILRDRGLLSRTVLSSFQPDIVRELGLVEPECRRFLLTEHWNIEADRLIAATDAGGVCLRVDAATDEVLAELAARELPVIVWTVNDPLRIGQLLERGIDAVISDDPGGAAEVRDGA